MTDMFRVISISRFEYINSRVACKKPPSKRLCGDIASRTRPNENKISHRESLTGESARGAGMRGSSHGTLGRRPVVSGCIADLAPTFSSSQKQAQGSIYTLHGLV